MTNRRANANEFECYPDTFSNCFPTSFLLHLIARKIFLSGATSTGGSFHTAASVQELEQVYQNIGSQIGYTTQQRDVSWRYLAVGLFVLFAAAGTSMLWAGPLV